MSASIITFADLGKKRNLKTMDILPVIERFEAEGALVEVVCRMERDAAFTGVRSAVPALAHYGLKALEKIVPFFPGRNLEEEILDIGAARSLKKADVVLFHPSIFPRSVRKAKRMGAVTVGIAVTVHPDTTLALNAEEAKLLSVPSGSRGSRSIFTQDTKSVANSFDYIIAVSEFVKRSYVDNGFPEKNICIAENDIDHRNYVSHALPGTGEVFRVVYVAHTTLLKGLHYLLDAWKSLALPNAELVIVGGYVQSVSPKLKRKYAEAFRGDASIVWAGFTRNPAEWYRTASLFVLPSITEGNPRVVMEAMACGLPVITTENAASIVEDGKTGYVVPIRDSKALASKIRKLYDDRALAQEMGNNGRQVLLAKQSFSDKVFAIYEELLRSEPHS